MVKTTNPRIPKNQATIEQAAIVDFDALHAVKHTENVVEYTLRCVLALAPNFEKSLIDAINKQVDKEFGGTLSYHPAPPNEAIKRRNDEIAMLYAKGERIAYLSRKFKISSRHISRILNVYR